MTRSATRVIHVAVGVVWRDGQILIARRPDSAHQGGLLEFPGGKVEPGETVQQALVRELREETGVSVQPQSLQPLIGIRHDYGDKQVFLDVWETRSSSGTPQGLEGQPVFWRSPGSLRAEDFPAANRPIINAVRLPRMLAITGNTESPQVAADHCLHGVQASGVPMMVLRLPSLTPAHYSDAVRLCVEGMPRTDVLIHDHPEVLAEVPAAGVHLSWRRASVLSTRPFPEGRWFGVSCHNGEELAHAAAIGADYATLGPVLPTPSHPGHTGMGWEWFSGLVKDALIPVYALGGVGPQDLDQALKHGGQGVAGISWWWPPSSQL